MRQLSIDGETWQFTVGRSHVRIIEPGGKSHDIAAHLVAQRDASTYERGQWKRTSDGMVTPKLVCEYVRSVLRPSKG